MIFSGCCSSGNMCSIPQRSWHDVVLGWALWLSGGLDAVFLRTRALDGARTSYGYLLFYQHTGKETPNLLATNPHSGRRPNYLQGPSKRPICLSPTAFSGRQAKPPEGV